MTGPLYASTCVYLATVYYCSHTIILFTYATYDLYEITPGCFRQALESSTYLFHHRNKTKEDSNATFSTSSAITALTGKPIGHPNICIRKCQKLVMYANSY